MEPETITVNPAVTVTVEGISDDRISVVGPVVGAGDYYLGNSDFLLAELSTGDLFELTYTDTGVWTAEHQAVGKLLESGGHLEITPNEGATSAAYSDTVWAAGVIDWVEVWESFPAGNKWEIKEKSRRIIDNLTPEDYELLWPTLSTLWRQKQSQRLTRGRRD